MHSRDAQKLALRQADCIGHPASYDGMTHYFLAGKCGCARLPSSRLSGLRTISWDHSGDDFACRFGVRRHLGQRPECDVVGLYVAWIVEVRIVSQALDEDHIGDRWLGEAEDDELIVSGR